MAHKKELDEALERNLQALKATPPTSEYADQLVENTIALYKASLEGEKQQKEFEQKMESAKVERRFKRLEVILKVAGIAAPLIAQTMWIVMSYIAESTGTILTSKTFRDFVIRALHIKL